LDIQVQTLDVEMNNRFIERFIAEDEEIQAALRGETLISESTGVVQADPWAKSNADILFELMAPWIYVNYQELNGVSSGRFKNTNNNRKTPWLRVEGMLSGAQIVSLDPEKAVVQLAGVDDVTQELYYISETVPPYDPTVPRTPEQVAEAQLRYREVYMKKFIVSNKEYERRSEHRTAVVPPRSKQLESKIAYFDYAKEFVKKGANMQPPREALIDASQLDPEQRAAYERYMSVYGRSEEEILESIERQQRELQQQLNAELSGEGQSGSGGQSN